MKSMKAMEAKKPMKVTKVMKATKPRLVNNITVCNHFENPFGLFLRGPFWERYFLFYVYLIFPTVVYACIYASNYTDFILLF